VKFYRFDPKKLTASVKHDTQVDSDLAGLINQVRSKDCIVLAGWDASAQVENVCALGIVLAVDQERASARIFGVRSI
jgi:hypothetical protein